MRNDVKKYYQTQFGSFQQLSAKEINELNTYEFQMLELPQVIYSRMNRMENEMEKILRKILDSCKN